MKWKLLLYSILGLYRENGKEHGNYYRGYLRVLGFRV